MASARTLSKLRSYEDFRAAASRRIPRMLFDYIDGGADGEHTLQHNEADFDTVGFHPRTGHLPAEHQPSLRTTVLGTDISMPVLTAPCGGMRLIHPQGDKAIALAAANAGIAHVTATLAGFTVDEMAKLPGPKIFQLYKFSDWESMSGLVSRAENAGFTTLMPTIDTAIAGNREKDFRNGFSYDLRINFKNIVRMAPTVLSRPGWAARYVRDGMPLTVPNTAYYSPSGKPLGLPETTRPGGTSRSPSWDELQRLRESWKGRFVIKGVITPEDAMRALSIGADGIVVSNHGGRQLDGVPSSIAALPDIVAEVGGQAEILLDSGIRRGSDVVKALALGADAVLIGRFPSWGLATGGRAGVERALSVLKEDITRVMHLLGCPSFDELNSDWLRGSGIT